MSETSIRLRVPSKPTAEYVEHGNFTTELKPRSVITVADRRFADWLVLEFGCAEVGDEPATSRPPRKKKKTAKPQAPAAVSDSGSEVTDDSGESQNDGGTE